MNKTNQTLSFPRLGKLIQHEININKQIYAFAIPIFMISLMAILFYFIASSTIFKAGNYIPFLVIGYFIMCVFLMGRSFPAFKNKYSSTIYLTLPASSLEKGLVQWLLRLALPLILYPILFWITANLTVELYYIFMSFYMSHDIWYIHLNKENFGFHHLGFLGKGEQTLVKLLFVSLYLGIPSILLLGSISANKWANIKTILACGILALLYVSFLVLLSHILYPDNTSGFEIQLNGGPLVYDGIPLMVVISIIFISAIPIVSWIAFYLKLKEREV